MQFHVLVGSLFAIQARVLEHDAKRSSSFIFLDRRIKPVQFNFSTGRIQKRRQHLDGRSFSGAIGAEEGKDFARIDGKGNVIDGGKVAELLNQIPNLDHRDL